MSRSRKQWKKLLKRNPRAYKRSRKDSLAAFSIYDQLDFLKDLDRQAEFEEPEKYTYNPTYPDPRVYVDQLQDGPRDDGLDDRPDEKFEAM